MLIKDVELKNFRNYENLKLKFHDKVNLILGNNAQGKTNLLESLFITSLGKSFRTSKDHEMIMFGADFGRVKVIVEKDGEEIPIEIIISGEGKSVKVGDVKIQKISELLEAIYVVIFSPEDLKIVKDEPEKRRRFVDRELSQLKPLYYSRLVEYKKTLRQRNAYLKENDPDKNVLDIWNTQLARAGAYVMIQRSNFIKKLNRLSKEIHRSITNSKEELEIFYESNIDLVASDKQEEIFKKTLDMNVNRDIFIRTTSKGPHKDDLKLEVNGIDIRKFGSQGQQRTAALSLKLAELQLIKEETDEDAILLLDDVLSELDYQRQNYLINSLNEVQLFITTTEISDEVKSTLPQGKTFYVNAGKIE